MLPNRKETTVLDNQTSARLEVLRFPLVLGVVFIHDGDAKSLTAQMGCSATHTCFVSSCVVNSIGNGISRSAVPLFFLMSGYLFFGKSRLTTGEYFAKLKRRLSTLLVPFLVWNFATLLGFAIAQALPATKAYFPSAYPLIRLFRPFDYINAILGITKNPVAFQFWFIRDLMVLVLLAPVIVRIICGRRAISCLVLVALLWFLDKWPVLWPSAEATLFFSLGAFLASSRIDLLALDDRGGLLVALFIPILGLYAVSASIELSGLSVFIVGYLLKLVILLAVAVAWWGTSRVVRRTWLKLWLAGLSGASFFVFAAHEPLMMIVRKAAFQIVPQHSGAAVLSLYVSIPIILVVLLTYTYSILNSVFPIFTAAITGGRGKDKHRLHHRQE
jgi:surface polysaccharide O-acyltransferase-like enzyme